jgi:phosphoribosylglycinamide formyltransferase-1
MRLSVLASHEGSTLQAVLDACASKKITAQMALVISNNSRSRALDRARSAGVATAHISSATHATTDAQDLAIVNALQAADTDWVVLCGYMKKLGPRTLGAFRKRILNTHPSLLPKYGGRGFYGRRVHQAVIDAADKESGATVHWVDEHYDTGEILAQVRLPVSISDTAEALEERIQTVERRLLVATIATLVSEADTSSNS